MLLINDISKIYHNNRGLNRMSIEINPGELVSIIGPNGCGKTTALNIMAGTLKSDSGSCSVNGMGTIETDTKKYIGFLEENPFFYGDISIVQFINFIWGIKYPEATNQEIYRLLEKFELLDIRNLRLKELSMGLRRRVGIITALMNYPPLIILDEPTNGLDTKSVLQLKEELLIAQEKNCMIIIASHILDFLKSISTRIIFLKAGEIQKDISNNNDVNLDDVYRSLYM